MKKYLLVITGTLLFALFIFKIGIKGIRDTFNLISIEYIIAIVLLNIPILILKTWRWKLLLSKYNLFFPVVDLFSSISSGFFLGLVTPGTFGELGRTLTTDISKSKGVGTVIFEKFFDLLLLFLLGVSSLVIYFLNPLESVLIILFICTAFAAFVYFLSSKIKLINYIFKYLSRFKITDRIKNLYQVFNTLLQDRKIVLISSLISLGIWTISGIQVFLILKAFNIAASIEMICVCYFLPYLAGVLSFIPLGLGVLDFSMAGLMIEFYAITNFVAYASVLGFRLFATFPLVVWGYICYLYKIINKNKIPVQGNNNRTNKKATGLL
jgi:uncharacterized protein (TIRG00374 family)